MPPRNYSKTFAAKWLHALCLSSFSVPLEASQENFGKSIQPLLKEYCITCHSTEKQKGDLDLERFQTLDLVKDDPAVWEHALEQIHDHEMPPKDKPQPSAEQMKLLTDWMQGTLHGIALANAGDPGPVVLRRLSNMEYTYTIRDLTGVTSLDPAKEFPVDGAAGEGFTNAGAALVMSPSLLTKYLDAAKALAAHAVLTPEGLRFSAGTSSRDWTDESLTRIREFYSRFTESGGGMAMNLQGVTFDTNAGGRLPVAKYLAALQGKGSADGLNPKYLATLREAFTGTNSSPLFDSLRAKFRAGTLAAADIEAWQQSLWRFASVGHIGKKDGPKGWQEPVVPLAAQHETRLKLAAPADGSDVILYLATSDAGDGSTDDLAVWENGRLVAPGRADLPLKDVGAVVQQLVQRREALIAGAAKCLAAAHEAELATGRTEIAKLAQKYEVPAEVLAGWLEYLGIGSSGEVKLEPLLGQKMESTPDYNFIRGWTGADALSVLANSSDAMVRIPGTMKPHSVATHPSPTLASVIAWRSPVTAALRLSGSVQHAHPECGNGVTWALELRRGHTREVLASGVSQGAAVIDIPAQENIRVLTGDVIAMVIGPRDGNHSCDLTAVDLVLNDGTKEWDLAKDVSPDILGGNPHADRHGNPHVWHFVSEPAARDTAPMIPAGSLLTKWRKTTDAAQREMLAAEVQELLASGPGTLASDSPDRALHTQLLSFNGPMLAAGFRSGPQPGAEIPASPYGLDRSKFTGANLPVQAPSLVEVRLPGWLGEGAELVVTGRLQSAEGSVQMQVLTTKPADLSGIAAGKAETAVANGQWSDNNLRTILSAPVIVNDGSAARQRFASAFDEFRALFPIVLCYSKIVPVDEVVTLTLFHREDEPLKRLMLDDAQIRTLDRLWEELRFVSESPLKQVDVFEQLYQFATQDASPSAFEPMREPIMRGAEAFKQQLVEVEPVQLQAVLDFATQAWRRPLSEAEQTQLRALYQKLRAQELPHAAAVRRLIARVLVAPAFLYRGEKAAPGMKAAPVNDWELATRLAYFLWSSSPDEELRTLAGSGRLHEPEVLVAQTWRMLKDPRVRRLATEFGCQWLHVRELETLDEKSERHFPTFLALRGAMQEEAVRFFMDLFQENRSVLSILDSDHTFMNGALAQHYGLEIKGEDWQRVDGLRAKGRGGVLGFASTLAKQSGASRTSPILRGTWLSEVILGDKLPNPPKGVPVLPEEAPQGLTERQLTERHSSDPKCSGCHLRVDPFGFALEGFDAIGRARTIDASGLSIDANTKLPDGTQVSGLDGLRNWLVTTRRDEFLRQFCRKLLGYALGRGVQLSDTLLLDEMVAGMKAGDLSVATLINQIVLSPQFREVRGRDYISKH